MTTDHSANVDFFVRCRECPCISHLQHLLRRLFWHEATCSYFVQQLFVQVLLTNQAHNDQSLQQSWPITRRLTHTAKQPHNYTLTLTLITAAAVWLSHPSSFKPESYKIFWQIYKRFITKVFLQTSVKSFQAQAKYNSVIICFYFAFRASLLSVHWLHWLWASEKANNVNICKYRCQLILINKTNGF